MVTPSYEPESHALSGPNEPFLHWIQVLHEPAAHNHGREEGRFPSRLDYLIRGTKPNGIVDQIMKASLETLNGRPSFYSQPKASFLAFQRSPDWPRERRFRISKPRI